MLSLANCRWIRQGANILITGPCGTGKTGIACALAHKACLEGVQAMHLRLPRRLSDLRIAHREGTITTFDQNLDRTDVIILDDWGLAPLDAARGRDLLEILDDRLARQTKIVTSHLPVSEWHGQITQPTVADAILDRLVHGADRFELSGDSLRGDREGHHP